MNGFLLQLSTIVLHLLCVSESFKGRIPIGAIFDTDDVQTSTGFQYAVAHSKERTKEKFELSALVEVIDVEDSFKLATSICSHLFSGVFVLLGSRAFHSQGIIKSYTNKFAMPYVTTSIPTGVAGHRGYEIYMKPPVTEAMRDMILEYKLKDVHYVYESDAGMIKLQELLKKLNGTDVKVRWHRLRDVTNAHEDLRKLDRVYSGYKNSSILMDFNSEPAYDMVLEQIRKLGMNKRGYRYILGTLNILNLNLQRFTHGGVNITGFQLLDYSAQNVMEFLTRWRSLPPNIWEGAGRDQLSVDAALAVDAVTVVQRTIQAMLKNNTEVFRTTFRRGDVYNNNLTKGIPCNDGNPWMHGDAIIHYIKKIDPRGLTGHLEFTKTGMRKGYKLDVYKVGLKHGPYQIGIWRPKDGFQLISNLNESKNDSIMGEETKRVTSILEKPFLMLKNTPKDGIPLVGNSKYEGFCADLIHSIASKCGFSYEIRPNKNGVYGKLFDNGSWNGMINELIQEEADLAAAPLTITMEREKVVDFSKPFMNTGISIMIKKPEKQKPGVFSFMKPFSVSLWMCIVIGYFVVSFGIFLVSRFSPTEWKRIRMRTGTEYLNKFTLKSSLWFSMGSLMLQGSDTCPRSAAGRIIGGTWWLVVLIVISSYTANLAAFLTIERLLTPISSADDLANHPDMSYGTLDSGSTQDFFENSNVMTYRKMWDFMKNHYPSVFVKSSAEGVRRVRTSKGKYAFLLESVYNEYFMNQEPCDTMQVAQNLNSKGYGIATPKGSPLRQKLSIAVLQLIEDGTLIKLKKKWWVDKGTCGAADSHGGSKKKSLSLSNVAGVFFILIGGLVMAIVLGVANFLRSKSKGRLGGVPVINNDAARSLLSDYREAPLNNENGQTATSDVHQSVPVKGILMNTCKLHSGENSNNSNHTLRSELYGNIYNRKTLHDR
ncbi:glutamate receptor-like [Ylistrum balloti]|uniref:glutamate receptor-like n=1 Tax=Ylistrum balloti TaxID=509963 RepID=UPI002905B0A0|nr:glutamate receptor-like [Ylistrum balloti]